MTFLPFVAAALVSAQIAAEAPQVVAVTLHPSGPRQLLVVRFTGDNVPVGVRRDENRLIVELAASSPVDLPVPPSAGVVRRVAVERDDSHFRVILTVSPEDPHEVRREPGSVAVYIGRADHRPSVDEALPLLFPGGVEPPPSPATGEAADDGAPFGAFRLNPSVVFQYVKGKASFEEGPEPQEDSYLEVRPRLTAGLTLGPVELQPDYEARFRFGSRFEDSNNTSHSVTAGVALPVGPRLRLTGRYHFIRGRNEVTEVDPGGEYFFGFARFRRHEAAAELTAEIGGSTRLLAGGSVNDVRLDESSSFFSYREWTARGGLRRDLGGRLVLDMTYGIERLPPPAERPVAEADAQTANASLRGDITPRLTGEVSVGYSRRHSPGAVEQVRDTDAFEGRVQLRQEITPSTIVAVAARRGQYASGYALNPFYTSSDVSADVTAPLPWELTLRGAVGFQVNQYPLGASVDTVSRRDEIFSWGAGIGRPFASWGFMRIDYSRSRRTSNVGGLSFLSDSLTAQLGLHPFASRSSAAR